MPTARAVTARVVSTARRPKMAPATPPVQWSATVPAMTATLVVTESTKPAVPAEACAGDCDIATVSAAKAASTTIARRTYWRSVIGSLRQATNWPAMSTSSGRGGEAAMLPGCRKMSTRVGAGSSTRMARLEATLPGTMPAREATADSRRGKIQFPSVTTASDAPIAVDPVSGARPMSEGYRAPHAGTGPLLWVDAGVQPWVAEAGLEPATSRL